MEATYKTYKPAWKSYYKELFCALVLIVLGGLAQYFKAGASWLKWMWIAIAIVDVLVVLYIIIKRSTMYLELRDDPSDAANQEVAFIMCNPLKPFSPDFRKSIEIGLANVMHMEVGQTMMQTVLGVGDLIITSSGTAGEEIRAKDIPNPSAVRDEIQVHARKYTMQI